MRELPEQKLSPIVIREEKKEPPIVKTLPKISKKKIDGDGFLAWLLTLDPSKNLTNASLITLIQKRKMYFLVRQFKDLYEQWESL